ncbi:MAG: kelch repeat-containing protein [Candidatus Thermoplasmatota archaeon]
MFILPEKVKIPIVEAGSSWTQSTDEDFNGGTKVNITITGIGVDAQIELAKIDGEWKEKNQANKPSPRSGITMATIYNDDKVVLFAGYNGVCGYLDDTWVYDLSDEKWEEKSPANRPPPRCGHATATIYNDDKVLIFGGGNDTWVYDLSNNNWEEKSPKNKPPTRYTRAMAPFYNEDKFLLFGGEYSGVYMNDTWVYDLSADEWYNKSLTNIPSARYGHTMAGIYNDDKILLFGGYDGSYRDDTWVYDLSDEKWYNKAPTNKPSGRYFHGMATVYNDDKVLLFGGDGSSGFRDDTWVYDLSDNQWYNKAPATRPSHRSAHAIATVYKDNKVLLFGGYDVTGRKNDIWVYDLVIFASSGSFVSQPKDTGGNSSFIRINWTAKLPTGTSLQFQLRTADTESNLSYKNFVGPGGETNSYYTSSGSKIWSGHDGDRLIQYKAYLSTTLSDKTPTLSGITINYNRLPEPPTLTYPANNTWTTNNTPTFTWIFIDVDSLSQAGFRWEADDDSSFSSINYDSGNVSSAITSYASPSAMTDGTWYWRVKTLDSDGAWGPYSNYLTVKVDGSPPSIMDIEPEDGEIIDEQKPKITANYSDDSGIDISSVVLKINGENVTSYSTITSKGISYIHSSALSEGKYTVDLEVRDNSANKNLAKKSWTFTISIVLPIAVIDIVSPNPANFSQEVSFRGHGISREEIITYEWSSSIDGFLSNKSSFKLSNLSVGEHTISFKVKDKKGIWSNAVSINLKIVKIEVESKPSQAIPEFWFCFVLVLVVTAIALTVFRHKIWKKRRNA